MNGNYDPSFIREDEAYTTHELKRRLGVGEDAIRCAQARGLPSTKFGRRKVFLGSDVLEYLRSTKQEPNDDGEE